MDTSDLVWSCMVKTLRGRRIRKGSHLLRRQLLPILRRHKFHLAIFCGLWRWRRLLGHANAVRVVHLIVFRNQCFKLFMWTVFTRKLLKELLLDDEIPGWMCTCHLETIGHGRNRWCLWQLRNQGGEARKTWNLKLLEPAFLAHNWGDSFSQDFGRGGAALLGRSVVHNYGSTNELRAFNLNVGNKWFLCVKLIGSQIEARLQDA